MVRRENNGHGDEFVAIARDASKLAVTLKSFDSRIDDIEGWRDDEQKAREKTKDQKISFGEKILITILGAVFTLAVTILIRQLYG